MFVELADQIGKTSAIRRIAVRETSVSGRHGGSIQAPLEPCVHHSPIVLRVSRGTLNWAPITARDASLSDN